MLVSSQAATAFAPQLLAALQSDMQRHEHHWNLKQRNNQMPLHMPININSAMPATLEDDVSCRIVAGLFDALTVHLNGPIQTVSKELALQGVASTTYCLDAP